MTKTAVIYARYSSDSQSEQSIEGQLRVCNEYAKNNDILILNTYIDRAMTGTNDNRPDFQRMIKDSNKKEWDFVIVYKLDRFSRNKYEATVHKKTLKDNGVKVLSAMENIPDSPEGIILESLLEGMNQYYSAELAQKVSRGMRETRLKGYFQGGPLPYGYKLNGRKVVIDETTAEIVRLIYEQYSLGKTVKEIISNLTATNILYKNKPFVPNTVYGMLKNEKYSGIYKCKEEIYTNIYPQIIPQEIYNKVRAKIDKNHYGKQSTEVVYLLRNKIKCGYCGKPIGAECGTAKNGTKKRYYKCLGRKNGSGCTKKAVRKDVLEKYVIDNIVDFLTNVNYMDYMAQKLLEFQDRNIKENVILNNLIKRQKQTKKSIDNIMRAIETGGTSSSVMKRLRELETQTIEIERQIQIEQAKSPNKLTKEDILRYYKLALEKEPKVLINYLVKEIKLFDDKIIITYNTPNNSLDDSQGYCFYNSNIPYPIYVQNVINPRMIDFRLIMKF